MFKVSRIGSLYRQGFHTYRDLSFSLSGLGFLVSGFRVSGSRVFGFKVFGFRAYGLRVDRFRA